jgi:hypothetical protein
VAIDGTECDTLDFCDAYGLAAVYSDEREGVGLSKNRVVAEFPDFDGYFFLDDDVEVVDGRVFPAHVEVARASGTHHLSLFTRGGLRKPTGASSAAGHRVVHGLFGGGGFSFYTREALDKVGGWHPRFAEYRRWGHTEHSYRVMRAGLAPAPFNFVEDLSDCCIWHWPPAVTANAPLPVDEDQIPAPERQLIDQQLVHVPLTTLSAVHRNGIDPAPPAQLAATLAGRDRYPLTRGRERRRCYSDFRLWQFATAPSRTRRILALAAAAVDAPRSPVLRHAVKTALRS